MKKPGIVKLRINPKYPPLIPSLQDCKLCNKSDKTSFRQLTTQLLNSKRSHENNQSRTAFRGTDFTLLFAPQEIQNKIFRPDRGIPEAKQAHPSNHRIRLSYNSIWGDHLYDLARARPYYGNSHDPWIIHSIYAVHYGWQAGQISQTIIKGRSYV